MQPKIGHDHKTGKIHGWLCKKHNTASGYCNDNPKEIYALAEALS